MASQQRPWPTIPATSKSQSKALFRSGPGCRLCSLLVTSSSLTPHSHPLQSLYEGGLFRLELFLPADYPMARKLYKGWWCWGNVELMLACPRFFFCPRLTRNSTQSPFPDPHLPSQH